MAVSLNEKLKHAPSIFPPCFYNQRDFIYIKQWPIKSINTKSTTFCIRFCSQAVNKSRLGNVAMYLNCNSCKQRRFLNKAIKHNHISQTNISIDATSHK